MELEKSKPTSLGREVSGNMKGFCRYFSSKGKSRENMGPLLKEVGDLEIMNTEKAEVLKAFFTLVCISKTCLQQS